MSKLFKLFLCIIIFIISSKETSAQYSDTIKPQTIAQLKAVEAEFLNQERYVIAKTSFGNYNGEISGHEDYQNIQANHFRSYSLPIGNGTSVLGNFSALNLKINSCLQESTSNHILDQLYHLNEWERSCVLKSYSCKYTWSRWMDESQVIVTKTHRSVSI